MQFQFEREFHVKNECNAEMRFLLKSVMRFVVNTMITEFGWLYSLSTIVIISICQFPVLSAIPIGRPPTPVRTILSFIRIIRAGAHFYGNFFVRFFCLELFHVNFFPARFQRLQHAVRYVTPHVPILSCLFPFFTRLCSVRFPVACAWKKEDLRISRWL